MCDAYRHPTARGFRFEQKHDQSIRPSPRSHAANIRNLLESARKSRAQIGFQLRLPLGAVPHCVAGQREIGIAVNETIVNGFLVKCNRD